jgi:hypothetical protein
MQQPVRYYIKTSGQQPTVRTVPVAVSHCAAPARERQTSSLGAPAVQVEPLRASGVARIRAAIRRGALHRHEVHA